MCIQRKSIYYKKLACDYGDRQVQNLWCVFTGWRPRRDDDTNKIQRHLLKNSLLLRKFSLVAVFGPSTDCARPTYTTERDFTHSSHIKALILSKNTLQPDTYNWLSHNPSNKYFPGNTLSLIFAKVGGFRQQTKLGFTTFFFPEVSRIEA